MILPKQAMEYLQGYFEEESPAQVAADILEQLGAKPAKQFFTTILVDRQRDAKGAQGEDKEYYDDEIRRLRAIIEEIDRQS